MRNDAVLPDGGTSDSLFCRIISLIRGQKPARDCSSRAGDIEKAMQDFIVVTKLDAEYANGWNNLCWYGSLSDPTTSLVDACDKAISLDPDNGNFYDSRGLARALTGDFEGAIADFTVYVEWTKEQGIFEQSGRKRLEWIGKLEMGVNPFNEETLEDLRQY